MIRLSKESVREQSSQGPDIRCGPLTLGTDGSPNLPRSTGSLSTRVQSEQHPQLLTKRYGHASMPLARW